MRLCSYSLEDHSGCPQKNGITLTDYSRNCAGFLYTDFTQSSARLYEATLLIFHVFQRGYV